MKKSLPLAASILIVAAHLTSAGDLPGPKIQTTITSIETQREEKTRPTYLQPKDLSSSEAPVTTLPLTPAKGEKIVFLGNSLAERMEHFGHFERALHESFPNREITFRNMGKPGDTPAFRPDAGKKDPWAFPDAKKFRPEIRKHLGKGHYPKPDEWLTILEADTIVAFFGFNESFDGPEMAENFKAELAAFTDHTLHQGYNGKTAPSLVLATPIAVEDRTDFALPNATERNAILAKYADAVKQVASEKNVGFLDLFTPTKDLFSKSAAAPLTINSVHLGDEGYKALAGILMNGIFAKELPSKQTPLLGQAIVEKSWFWRNDYRMLNGVHSYGQRWAPYGNFNYPEEIEKIRQMTVLRDENIWKITQGKSTSLAVNDDATRPLTPVPTNYVPSEKNGTPDFLMEEEALKKFDLPEGYKVSVFATEQEFPNLGNPAQIRFDNNGRVWVSTVPSYPHYKPGGEMPNDKLLIYEDTDGDGRADKETVFADKLHVPIGFEITPEGVYISEEPYLTIHKDTDGDDKADTKDYLLDGFDSHDTHHAISAFDQDNGGALFMCEGRFLHSQVETPWGPQRMTDGGVWRFDPHSWKIERVLQTDVSNPWGVAHDEFGQTFLNDASGGAHWWMAAYSMRIPHGDEMRRVEKFNYEHSIRPSSGNEFLHSRVFPDEVQGDYLYANTIGFLGIKQFDTVEDGTAIKGKHRQDMIQSSDGNFRPCDLRMAPDGSIYFVDWHNTLIGHMQHSARDPLRNSAYGRIYKITYEGRDLVEPPKVAGANLDTLFENFKLPELSARKWSHKELRGRSADEVIAKAHAFAEANAENKRLTLESLWATWGQQQPSVKLIDQCLAAADHRVRAGATRVVRHCLHLLDPADIERILMKAAADIHGRVRLEALSASTWLSETNPETGAKILLTVASQETDKWIRNALNASMRLMKPAVIASINSDTVNKEDIKDYDKLLAMKLPGAPKRKNYMTDSVKKARKKDRDFQSQYRLGLKIFHEEGSCATCHMETGEGLAAIYPPIAKSPWITGDKERLIKLTLHGIWGDITVNGVDYLTAKGVPPMTAVGAMFSDGEMAAVLTYVRNSWGNEADSVTADEVRKVRAVTKDQKIFYKPEELIKEHPFPEGIKSIPSKVN